MKKGIKLWGGIILLCVIAFLAREKCVFANSAEKNASMRVEIAGKDQTEKTYKMKSKKKATIQVFVANKKIAAENLEYHSYDEKVAEISEKGVVKAKKTGTAKIKITRVQGKKKIHTWVKIKVISGRKIEKTVVYAHVGEEILEIKLEDNSSARAFSELLAENDVTIDMNDYGSFEKVGSLGTTLPTNDTQITTEPGDVILYQGNQITIYYDVNSWKFTKLGKVQNLSQDELKEVLGIKDVTIRFSLSK